MVSIVIIHLITLLPVSTSDCAIEMKVRAVTHTYPIPQKAQIYSRYSGLKYRWKSRTMCHFYIY